MNMAIAIYLISIADRMINTVIAMMIAACVIGVVALCAYCIGSDPCLGDFAESTKKQIVRIIKASAAVALTCAVFSCAIPSSRGLAAMYLIPKIIHNEQLTEIAGNSMEAIRLLTRDWLINLGERSKGKNDIP